MVQREQPIRGEKNEIAVQHFYKLSGFLPLQQALTWGYDAKLIW